MADETPLGYVVSVGQPTGYRPTFLAASPEYKTTSAWTHARIFDRLADAEHAVEVRGGLAQVWAITPHTNGQRRISRLPVAPRGKP